MGIGLLTVEQNQETIAFLGTGRFRGCCRVHGCVLCFRGSDACFCRVDGCVVDRDGNGIVAKVVGEGKRAGVLGWGRKYRLEVVFNIIFFSAMELVTWRILKPTFLLRGLCQGRSM